MCIRDSWKYTVTRPFRSLVGSEMCIRDRVNRKYVYTVACTVVFVGPAGRHFVFNAYSGRNAACPLSNCSNKNAVALTVLFCTLARKGTVCVEV